MRSGDARRAAPGGGSEGVRPHRRGAGRARAVDRRRPPDRAHLTSRSRCGRRTGLAASTDTTSAARSRCGRTDRHRHDRDHRHTVRGHHRPGVRLDAIIAARRPVGGRAHPAVDEQERRPLPLGHRADRHAVVAAHRVPHAPTGRKVHFVSPGLPAPPRRDGVVALRTAHRPHRHPPHRPGARCSPRPPAASGATSWAIRRSRCGAAPAAGRGTRPSWRASPSTASTTGSSSGTTATTRASPPRRSARPCRAGRSGPTPARTARPPTTSRARADSVLADARAADTDVVLVGHGHFSRVLVSRWLAPPGDRRRALRDGRRGLGRARATSGACRASTALNYRPLA